MSGNLESHSHAALLADVGGTHARFALHLAREEQLEAAQVIACAAHASLEDAVSAYLAALGIQSLQGAAIAVAGPVQQHQSVTLTNLGWHVTTENLAQACGLRDAGRVSLLNDFEAVALALPHVPAYELRHLAGPQSLQAAQGTRAVIGPGTGLGVAGLLHVSASASNSARPLQAIVGEGGHMSACPGNAREWRIIEYCHAQGYTHVSWERLLSGTGLPLLHAAVCAVDGYAHTLMSAEQIGALALSGKDVSCVATIDTFSAMLGSFAADVALVMGATAGLYIAGGIIPKLGKAFAIDKFHARFLSKGRFAPYLAAVPIYLIESEYPAFAGLRSLVENQL